MEFYAVGYKGWVEVRTASTPPRRKLSTVTIKYKKYSLLWNPNLDAGWGGWENHATDAKKKIDVSVYKGGNVVATVPTTLVRSRIGLTIPQGTMVHLLPDQAETLLRDTGNAVEI